MNNAFIKTKLIELDSNYNLRPDSGNGVILTFTETRKKETIITQEGKKINTGLYEPFLFKEQLCFPRIAQALKYYATATINNSDCLSDIIYKSNMVYELIEKLDKEFKQF